MRLEDAAQCLVFQGCPEGKHKTKVRRLYDIANVLCSLRLIEKMVLSNQVGRKPAFVWTGPNLDNVVPDQGGSVLCVPTRPCLRVQRGRRVRQPDDSPSLPAPSRRRLAHPAVATQCMTHPPTIDLSLAAFDARPPPATPPVPRLLQP